MSSTGVQTDGPGHDAAVEDAKAYNGMVSASVDLSNAHVSSDGNMLTVTRTVRDIDADKKRKYLYTIPIPKQDSKHGLSMIPPTEVVSDIRTIIPSPSGDKMVILKQPAKDNGDASAEQEIMEIWTNQCQCLSQRIMLPKAHGKVCSDPGWFGPPSWNHDETAIVYSAERKDPETKSFFDATKSSNDKSTAPPVAVGGQNTLGLGKSETWGEKYSKMSALLDLYCLSLETGQVGLVENVPGNGTSLSSHGGYTLGQPVFSSCGRNVVYTAWDAGDGANMPRRLGMIYCYQRPCQIFTSSVSKLLSKLSQQGDNASDNKDEDKDPSYTCLTPKARLARSPRFQKAKENSTMAKLAYLSCQNGFDTHDGAVSLHTMDWNMADGVPVSNSDEELVGMVDLPTYRNGNDENDPSSPQVANMSFPGLFLNQLPVSCFAPNDDYILTTTLWGSIQRIVQISLADQSLTPLKINVNGCGADTESDKSSSVASQSFLCFTRDGGALVSESAPNQPAAIGYVTRESLSLENPASVEKRVEATLVSKMAPISASQLSFVRGRNTLPFDYEVMTIPAPTVSGAVDTSLQCILLRPRKEAKDEKPPPLLVVPHGGPHSCSASTFIPSYAYLCAHGGYAVLFTNYRGSTGFGMAALNSLPGNVGVVDVADVVQATRIVRESGLVDASRVGICGGSHGGFLAGHLLGQHPDLFKAAAMRNPVTNIATMVSATDIADWCYVETFGVGQYDWKKFRGPTAEQLEEMWKSSPIAHVEKVVAPTLIALGMSDRRVPPSQGLEFYHALRSKGVKVKLLMYEKDDHAIDVVASEADHWINIKRWFDEHLCSFPQQLKKNIKTS